MTFTNQTNIYEENTFLSNKSSYLNNTDNYLQVFNNVFYFNLFRLIFLSLFFLLVILTTINRVSLQRLRI